MPDENERTVSITKLTIPVMFVMTLILALGMTSARFWWEAKEANFRLETKETIDAAKKDIIAEVNRVRQQVDRIANETTEGRFGRTHYKYLRRFVERHPDLPWPAYTDLHDLVIEEESREDN